MKTANFIFATILLSSIISSCKKEPCCSPDPGPSLQYIRFDNLAVGQKSKYITLWGEGYFLGQTDNFMYMDDTLVLEVVDKDPQKGFKIEERLAYSGDLSPTWLGYDKDSVYYYYLRVEDDSLKILPVTGNYHRSRIFQFDFLSPKLPLKPISNPEIEIEGWMTNLPYCECDRQGFVKNYTLFGRIYPRLNLVMQNSPMALDGSGTTIVYTKSDGIVRFSTYSWWTQGGYGFDLLP